MKLNGHKQILALLFLAMSYKETLAQPSADLVIGDALLVEGRNDSSAGILKPSRSIDIETLQNSGSSSLGESMSNQTGINSTGFGAAATRPVIRGLEGNRVEILQNGMNNGDVSAFSNDHAVTGDTLGANKVEILRGPAALKYGSSSSGGLLNILNDRIATESLPPSAIIDSSLGTVDQSRRLTGLVEGGTNNLAIRADFGQQNVGNYLLPNGTRLPYSFFDQKDVGLGLSYIESNGYTGFSLMQRQNYYGIPSAEGSMIDQKQNRFDFAHLTNAPLAGIKSIEFKAGYTDYQHLELDQSGSAQSKFSNQQFETRVDLLHEPIIGWTGGFGLNYVIGTLSAAELGAGANIIVPKTDSNALSLYVLESKSLGPVLLKWGARYEYQQFLPTLQGTYATGNFSSSTPTATTIENKSYNLFSYSGSLEWNYATGYLVGLTYSQFARAPGIGELFAYGPHDATATFDIGSSTLSPEISRNWELSWKKHAGRIQSQLGVYQNTISNFIYGQYTGSVDTLTGFQVRQFTQANAIIQGIEGDITYNSGGMGLSGRLFGDLSRGTLVDMGNLPLQPAPRVGLSVTYRHDSWEEGFSWLYAASQTNLASFETAITPSYNRIDANLTYKAQLGSAKANFFVQIRNLLNDEIRYSTTVEALRTYAPQAGRGLFAGVKLVY